MSDNLGLYYQNTRGLRGKIRFGLKNNFTLANHDCICLTETWLNDNINSNELFDDTYNVFRADRSVQNYNTLRTNRPNLQSDANIAGGGCLMALKKNISAMRMTRWESEVPFDNVWLKVNTSNNNKLFINTIYIPGWASFEHVNLYFEQLFDIINAREPYARFILIGDFNLPCIDWFPNGDQCTAIRHEGRFANELLDTMTASNVAQRNTITNKFGRILDLIISNVKITVERTEGIVKEDDYHPSLYFELEKQNIKFIKSSKTIKHNFFKANYDNINDDMERIDWTKELDSNNVDEAVDSFYSIIHRLIEKHVPTMKIKPAEFPKWYSTKLIELIKRTL